MTCTISDFQGKLHYTNGNLMRELLLILDCYDSCV